jgi:hypothetical protein
MMTLRFLLAICCTMLFSCKSLNMGDILNQGSTVTVAEVAQGLREALKQGTNKGTEQASKVNGYFANALLKIAIPQEMKQAEQTLRGMGFNKLIDDFHLSMNRAAEQAAAQAKPIFINAITSMTIQDAWSILKGQNDAATVYLKRTTGTQLYNAFKPVINNALQSVNATKYYSDIAAIYNKIPLVTPINTDLGDYVTNKGIDGLFVLIKQEEANIRSNPAARVTEILRKVFTPENMRG